MKRDAAALLFATLPIDPQSSFPLHQQLYDRLRDSILAGKLQAGARLPSTRALATELCISRNTVVDAFEQLKAEGYLESRHGSGTFVSGSLPEHLLIAATSSNRDGTRSRGTRSLSSRGTALTKLPYPVARGEDRPRPFQRGLPALDAFPFATWTRLARRRLRRWPETLLGYGHPAGYSRLREAIATYLALARGVRCTVDQVVVVHSNRQALDVAARLLLDPGEAIWFEDPGHQGARTVFMAAGARLIPVPVDCNGLDVAAAEAQCPRARLAYVSPSHQSPLGVTMSIGRRLALLQWASRANAWVIEDDYCSEFRFSGRPLPALQGLDSNQRVIYVGSFSHLLYPSIRVAYVVAPLDLVDAFIAARANTDRHAASFEQAVLADFMSEGHFARHLRRMGVLYAERQEILVRAARQELEGVLEVHAGDGGIHVIALLPPGVSDRRAVERAAAAGVTAQPLSSHYLGRPRQGGLILGYGAITPAQIRSGVRALAGALRRQL
jgi:GntR family transcriptional regulator/MocR family aminotransferase